jgi:hypothetical protein
MKTISVLDSYRNYNWKRHMRSMEKEEEREGLEDDDFIIEAEFEDLDDDDDDEEETEVEAELSPEHRAAIQRRLHARNANQEIVASNDEGPITKEQLMMWLYMLSCEAEKSNTKNAKKIRKLKPFKIDSKPNALNAYLHRALQDRNDGLHIEHIIGKVLELGYQTKSKYHLYSRVSRLLNKQYEQYEKVGKAKFKLRNIVSAKDTSPTVHIQHDKKLASLQDVIIMMLRRFNTTEGLHPSHVKDLLDRCTGGRISYDQIHRAMQDESVFDRNGPVYAIKKTDNATTIKNETKDIVGTKSTEQSGSATV